MRFFNLIRTGYRARSVALVCLLMVAASANAFTILDLCPDDPDKISPGICGCGVPDADSDRDGILDCLDQCPLDGSNVDADLDGVPDCIDICAADPNKIIPLFCGCGVPETDSDGDFLPDCVDQCPSDSLKFEFGLCGCGVSDLNFSDVNGNQIPDCLDPSTTTPPESPAVKRSGDGSVKLTLPFFPNVKYIIKIKQLPNKGKLLTFNMAAFSRPFSKVVRTLSNKVSVKNLNPGRYSASYQMQMNRTKTPSSPPKIFRIR